MHEFVSRTVAADRRDRFVAEAEAYHLGRAEIAEHRRPSFVLRLMRRLAQARRATPITAAPIGSAAAPRTAAPTT